MSSFFPSLASLLGVMQTRIQCLEGGALRGSSGSSTEGESGPKIRPRGVVDGQRVNIPVLPREPEGGGTAKSAIPIAGSGCNE